MAQVVDQKTGFIGLVTNVSRISAPPGALDVAENVVIRKPGVVENRNGVVPITVAAASVGPSKIFDYAGYPHFYSSSGAWYQYSSATKRTLVNTAGTTIDPALFREDLLSILQARGNCYVGTQKGVLKLTSGTDTSFDESGMGTPMRIDLFLTAAGTPTALATGFQFAYRAVVKRTDANGLVTRGIPSAAVVIQNTSGATRNVQIETIRPQTTYFGGTFALLSTDEIEYYRTRAFATTATIDEEYALVATQSASVAVAGYFYTDSRTDAQRGASLYTSPSQGGAISENQRPPACGCMETFKGHVFYGNTVGPFRKVVSANFSTTNIAGSSTGIGYRIIASTCTSGSALITGMANTTGLQAGMHVSFGNAAGTGHTFPVDTYILSVDSAVQVTVSANATETRTANCYFVDSVLVGGQWKPIFPSWNAGTQASTPVVSGLSVLMDNALVSSSSASTTFFARGISPALTPYSYTMSIEELTRSLSTASTQVLKATHGNEYYPALPLYASTALDMDRDVFPDGIAWSKKDEPEHVPPLNYARVGDKRKNILGLACTRDSLFILKEDGIWRLSGSGGNGDAAWRIDPFDLTTFCVLPQSVQKLNNRIYFLSNKGVVRLSEGGVEVISMPINDQVKRVIAGIVTDWKVNGYYSLDSSPSWSCGVNETDSEYMLSIGAYADKVTGILVYNELTNAWVSWSMPTGGLNSWAGTYPSAISWCASQGAALVGPSTVQALMRLSTPGEASSVLSSLGAADEGKSAITISSATLVSGNSYTLVYSPSTSVRVGDVIVDAALITWTVTTGGTLGCTVIRNTDTSDSFVPEIGAATAVASVATRVRAKPFLSPPNVQKQWVRLQAVFAQVLGAVKLELTTMSSIDRVLSDTTAQVKEAPEGISYINGYAAAYRGNQYRVNVPTDSSRSLELWGGVEIRTPFGQWSLEALNVIAKTADQGKPTIAQTGST